MKVGKKSEKSGEKRDFGARIIQYRHCVVEKFLFLDIIVCTVAALRKRFPSHFAGSNGSSASFADAIILRLRCRSIYNTMKEIRRNAQSHDSISTKSDFNFSFPFFGFAFTRSTLFHISLAFVSVNWIKMNGRILLSAR